MAVGEFHRFKSREELATALAKAIGENLSNSIKKSGAASLAVSGGSTPKHLFEKLSALRIDWPNVAITLVDDRCVPPDHDRSNEKLVRKNLLQEHAASARFIPLVNEQTDILDVPRPLSVAVLGMGTDGHTASFFPGGDMLAEATDPHTNAAVVPMNAPGAGEPRVTMTLPLLAMAETLILHIEGDEKRSVLEDALKDGPADDMPIRHILHHPSAELEIYWSP